MILVFLTPAMTTSMTLWHCANSWLICMLLLNVNGHAHNDPFSCFIFVQMCQPFSKNAWLRDCVCVIPSCPACYCSLNSYWKVLLDFLFALFPSSLFLCPPTLSAPLSLPVTPSYTIFTSIHTHTYSLSSSLYASTWLRFKANIN